jgi:hypothetical protein
VQRDEQAAASEPGLVVLEPVGVSLDRIAARANRDLERLLLVRRSAARPSAAGTARTTSRVAGTTAATAATRRTSTGAATRAPTAAATATTTTTAASALVAAASPALSAVAHAAIIAGRRSSNNECPAANP